MTSEQKSNGFKSDEFLDTFGREFYKYEVLWKPKPKRNVFQKQLIKNTAYRKLARALNLSLEAIHDLSESFPAACLNLRSRCAARRVPEWLLAMAKHFRSKKRKKPERMTFRDLVRALCESARKGLWGGGEGSTAMISEGGVHDDASPLECLRIVANFAARYSVNEKEVLTAWRSVYKLCMLKLRALLWSGDRSGVLSEALRLEPHEWEVTDLALLHDPKVSQVNFLTPAKLRSLVLLFQLIIAAKELYDRGKQLRHDDAINKEVTPNSIDTDNRNLRAGSVGNENILFCSKSKPHYTEDVNDTPINNKSLQTTISDKMAEAKRRQERHIKCKPRRKATDTSAVTAEESADNELHTELDLEPDVNVPSSDMIDDEISNEYLEKCSKNLEDPILVNNNQTKESVDNIMNNYEMRFRQKESNIASKSQDSDARSTPRKDIQSCSSEEQRVVWALVYTDFIKRGRSASLISLQHRWVEVLHLARAALLTAWQSSTQTDMIVHPLLLVVAHWFPEIVTEHLLPWKALVSERQIVLESDIKDIINKYQENENLLLNITEGLASRDLVKEYLSNKSAGVNDVHGQSNKQLSYTINNESPSSVTDNIHKVIEQECQTEDSAGNNHISTMLEQIDPSKAKVSIIIDEDSDEDTDETNLHVLNSKEATYLREKDTQTSCSPEKCIKHTEIAMKDVQHELQDKSDYINNPINTRSDLCVTSSKGEVSELRNDGGAASDDFGTHDELGLLQPRNMNIEEVGPNGEYKKSIDEKLLDLCLVVITPIEHLPEWKKHSRNGVVKCRNFSVRNFTKRVIVNPNQLHKCRSYINRNRRGFGIKDNNYLIKSEILNNQNKVKNKLRIKFEDDSFDSDDVNNGIVYHKYVELYGAPERERRRRINLTRILKLSRTYFSLNFWSLDRNIELMKLCKPINVKLSKLPAVTKNMELSDTKEGLSINCQSTVRAPPSPGALDAASPDVQGSSASPETVHSTLNNNSSSSSTTRQINSLSSASDSSETPPYGPHPADSSVNSSDTHISNNISATNIFNTVEMRNNPILDSFNSSVPHATGSKIHVTSPSTKELHKKHQHTKRKNITDQKESKLLNVCNFKDMILLLAKNVNPTAKDEYADDINLDRSSVTLHLKKFEKQQNALLKKIIKLYKVLPGVSLIARCLGENCNVTFEGSQQFISNMEPKRKVVKNNKQKNEESKSPGGDTDTSTDEHCEPNLVIDEGRLGPTDDIDLNNLQCNNIQRFDKGKNDNKEKKRKKAGKRNKQADKIVSEEEKPMLNEYQEWQRQRTMALKYFTLPMTDKKPPLKEKTPTGSQQSAPATTDTQSNGCQTTVSIKRKNTKCLTTKSTASDITKRAKLTSNKAEVICISDASSEDEVQITECNIPTREAAGHTKEINRNRARPELKQSEKPDSGNRLYFVTDPSKNQVRQNVCVINAPVAAITQPLYLVINSQKPAVTQDTNTTNTEVINDPFYFQVFPNASTPSQTGAGPPDATPRPPDTPCHRQYNTECNCSDCQNTRRDDFVSCTMDSIESVSCRVSDLRNTTPTASPLAPKKFINKVITVEEYLAENKKLTALIKVDGSEKVLFLCNKYLILTDVYVPDTGATYRTSFRTDKYKSLSQVLVPEGEGGVLLLGRKGPSDYINCKCVKSARVKCNLCLHIEGNLPKQTNFLKINDNYYKKMHENPISYVCVNGNELKKNSPAVLGGSPELMLINEMYFKRLTEEPPAYVRILSAVPNAAVLRHLVRREVLLYAFDVTTTKQRYHKPLAYTRTDGRPALHHADDDLVRLLHRII